jgi:NAD(P)H-dependent FMN reductase
MIRLTIILCSTRPGRKGPLVADWILKLAKRDKQFTTRLIDLQKEALPFHDEPEMPATRKYKHAHTRRWSRKIDAADAFIFVHPEYNHGYSAPLKNALDYLFQEWNYKPAGFVSYGGAVGGSRASELLIPVVTALKMMPMTESVHLADFTGFIGPGDTFDPGEKREQAALNLLKALALWSYGLKKIRDRK